MSEVAGLALSWIFFSIEPVAFSAVIAACIGLGAWLLDRSPRLSQKLLLQEAERMAGHDHLT